MLARTESTAEAAETDRESRSNALFGIGLDSLPYL